MSTSSYTEAANRKRWRRELLRHSLLTTLQLLAEVEADGGIPKIVSRALRNAATVALDVLTRRAAK